jgi:hypothetical protein
VPIQFGSIQILKLLVAKLVAVLSKARRISAEDDSSEVLYLCGFYVFMDVLR